MYIYTYILYIYIYIYMYIYIYRKVTKNVNDHRWYNDIRLKWYARIKISNIIYNIYNKLHNIINNI